MIHKTPFVEADQGARSAKVAAVAGALRDSADVGKARERARQKRLLTLGLVLLPVACWLWVPVITGGPLPLPPVPAVDPMYLIIALFFIAMLAILVGSSIVAGRSPHVTYRPEQINVSMADVKGIGPVKDEVSRSLDLFLAGQTFSTTMGGTPRRGLLFEGTPGTGKTLMAKAMAAEAGVPFLFVSATSFQSMYYGATARKIRSYFKAVRKAARAEGGAIAFVEEIDAIAMARGGMNAATAISPSSPMVANKAGMTSEGTGGVVNELLVQLQSFDELTGVQKFRGKMVDWLNSYLPVQRQLRRPKPDSVDILLIAATNRADNLDPALLRPGRFDRRLTFDLPDKAGRRELVDHFLATKAHDEDLADDQYRDALAGVTQGYSPAKLENLLDEGLINAVRRGTTAMTWQDIEQARMVVEVGVGKPVGYTEHEKRLIATHEAGHAVVAWLEAPERRLEILTIVKRAEALGLLAHGDKEDVYTRSRTELTNMIRIAFGGMVAEELFFGDISTGPSGDLSSATSIAAQMIGAAGMGDTLVSFAAIQQSAVANGNLVSRVLGDSEAREMVEQLLTTQRDYVRTLLQENRHLVAALRDALLERHELIGRAITDVLENAQEEHREQAQDGQVVVVDVSDASIVSKQDNLLHDGEDCILKPDSD